MTHLPRPPGHSLARAALWAAIVSLLIFPAAILYGVFTGADIDGRAYALAAICAILAGLCMAWQSELSWRNWE